MDEYTEVLIYNVSLVIGVTALAFTVTPWALLALTFGASTHDNVRVEHNGSVVEIECKDAEDIRARSLIKNAFQEIENGGSNEQ